MISTEHQDFYWAIFGNKKGFITQDHFSIFPVIRSILLFSLSGDPANLFWEWMRTAELLLRCRPGSFEHNDPTPTPRTPGITNNKPQRNKQTEFWQHDVLSIHKSFTTICPYSLSPKSEHHLPAFCLLPSFVGQFPSSWQPCALLRATTTSVPTKSST